MIDEPWLAVPYLSSHSSAGSFLGDRRRRSSKLHSISPYIMNKE
jgi:hypothetical protein